MYLQNKYCRSCYRLDMSLARVVTFVLLFDTTLARVVTFVLPFDTTLAKVVTFVLLFDATFGLGSHVRATV